MADTAVLTALVAGVSAVAAGAIGAWGALVAERTRPRAARVESDRENRKSLYAGFLGLTNGFVGIASDLSVGRTPRRDEHLEDGTWEREFMEKFSWMQILATRVVAERADALAMVVLERPPQPPLERYEEGAWWQDWDPWLSWWDRAKRAREDFIKAARADLGPDQKPPGRLGRKRLARVPPGGVNPGA